MGLALALIALRGIFESLPAEGMLPSQRTLLTWTAVFVVLGLGTAGLYLSRRTGFPRLWETAVTNQQRFLLPATIGMGASLVWSLMEISGTFDVLRPTLPGNAIHTPWPTALITYPAGGLILEITLRLFFIPLLIWLISSLLLKGRVQTAVFWVAAVLVALIEPLGLAGPVLQSGAGITLDLTLLFGVGYLLNLILAYLFRRYGFLAPLTARFCFYLGWHILFVSLF